MKVLFWLSGSYDQRDPSEYLLADMVKTLYEKGHTVHILQKNTNGPQEALPTALVELGVETTRIDFAPAQKGNLVARLMADAKSVLQCRNWLKEHKEFDRIFMQSSNVAGIQTRILSRLQKRIPVIFNVQAGGNSTGLILDELYERLKRSMITGKEAEQ